MKVFFLVLERPQLLAGTPSLELITSTELLVVVAAAARVICTMAMQAAQVGVGLDFSFLQPPQGELQAQQARLAQMLAPLG
jgi:hypothetical protein